MLIRHVVVLMLENRSYDNILGGLYLGGTAPLGQKELKGLTGSESNLGPKQKFTVANQVAPTTLSGLAASYPPTCIPLVDPGETFPNVAQQITGSDGIPSSNPYPNYSHENVMGGFVSNYADPQLPSLGGGNLQDVMNYFSATQLPVTAFLARNFAVCDNWFASVPTQTYTNRVFAFCAAPGIGIQRAGKDIYSWVDDAQYVNAKTNYELPSILTRLDEVMAVRRVKPPHWKVYFHDYSITMATMPAVAKVAASAGNSNVSTFDTSDWGPDNLPKGFQTLPSTFVEDAAKGALPPFSFIEPRYFNDKANVSLPPNSNHPGGAEYGAGTAILGVTNTNPPIDVSSGECLLMQVYNALRTSPNWDETLFIVTYDEHGGLYDSVAPPPATPPCAFNLPAPPAGVPAPPYPNIPAAQDAIHPNQVKGFNYVVFGVRVPAIIISPHIAAGSQIAATTVPFDHTSIIRTVWDIFGLTVEDSANPVTSLTARDAAAPSLVGSLHDAVVNNTGAFAETIILASPGSLVFERPIGKHTSSQTLLAYLPNSTAAIIATASVQKNNHEGNPWLTVQTAPSSIPNGFTVTVSAEHMGLGVSSGKITLSADGYPDVVIPVTFKVVLVG